MPHVRLLTVGEAGVLLVHAIDRLDAVKSMRERLNPLRPQPLDLRPPSSDQLREPVFLISHRRGTDGTRDTLI
jgi:hypothetical protein